MTIKNIPVGYKDSPLGIIPQEWEVKKLGDLCNSINSGGSKQRNDNGKYPIYGSTGLIGYSNVCIYDIPQILVARVGAHAGYVYCVDGNYDVSDNTLILNLKSTYHFDFAYNQLLHCNLNKYVFGSGQPLVTAGRLKLLKLPLPPLAEQEKIAEILSTWDKAIDKQTQLIEKLELRKKGLMQQLLTGKKRLPGFTGEWKKIAIKYFATEVSLKNRLNENWEVLSCTKYDGLVSSLQYFGRQVFSKDVTKYKIVPQYSFAYATNHIEEGSIGYQGIYKNALISPMYTVFKTDANLINDVFLYKLLKSHHAMYLYHAMMEGSIDRRGGLRWDNFSKIKFVVPSLQEQTAIANILSLCDKEIRLSQDKLVAMKKQKKGLMQVLLTGKKRVKI